MNTKLCVINQDYCRHTEMSANKASGIAVGSVVQLIGQSWQRNNAAYHMAAKKQQGVRGKRHRLDVVFDSLLPVTHCL